MKSFNNTLFITILAVGYILFSRVPTAFEHTLIYVDLVYLVNAIFLLIASIIIHNLATCKRMKNTSFLFITTLIIFITTYTFRIL